MSLSVNIWSKVAVAVQTVRAAAKTISGITKANPAVVTSTAHGYVDGDYVLLLITGMSQLDYRIVRVDDKTDDTFECEGIDSAAFDTFVSGTAEKLTFGANAATFQDVNGSGSEAAPVAISTIHNDQDFEIPGNRSPLVFTFGSLWDVADPALLALNAFDAIKTACGVLITFATGAKVLMMATPSASLAPTGSSGAPVTTPVSLRVRGRLTFLAT
jgi:hypothetical protein